MTMTCDRLCRPRRAAARRFAIAALSALAVFGLSLGVAPAVTFVTAWGSSGSGAGQFNYPHGIAVDAHGHVYVTDPGNGRIQEFTSNGRFLRKWGDFGRDPSEFEDPMDVAVDPQSNDVYVADTHNSRIQKFTSTGQFLASWGRFGHKFGQFDYPDGVAVDAQGGV